MEASNLSDAEFKALVIRLLKELSEGLNSIKKTQSETKDSLTETKNNLQGHNSRVSEAKNQINHLERKEAKTTMKNKKKKKNQKRRERMRRFWDISKSANIQIIGRPEGVETEQEIENLFEKLVKEKTKNTQTYGD